MANAESNAENNNWVSTTRVITTRGLLLFLQNQRLAETEFGAERNRRTRLLRRFASEPPDRSSEGTWSDGCSRERTIATAKSVETLADREPSSEKLRLPLRASRAQYPLPPPAAGFATLRSRSVFLLQPRASAA